MKDKVFATADFRVYGMSKFTKKPVDTTVHFVLLESGGFDYGNGTCMIMKFKDADEHLYDTRYEKGIKLHFKEYAFEFIKNYIADTLTAEPID